MAPIRLPAATSYGRFPQGWFGLWSGPKALPRRLPGRLSSGLLPEFTPPPLRGQRRDLTGFSILRPSPRGGTLSIQSKRVNRFGNCRCATFHSGKTTAIFGPLHSCVCDILYVKQQDR
ncbi:hypothetical protein SAMCCGM7_Ch0913 [Sinorhizobium americanum CCGM7]|nr:hypothetical protein SAMCCGM7_Ch0913 [Sinorhizobium americanum CCGM7]